MRCYGHKFQAEIRHVQHVVEQFRIRECTLRTCGVEGGQGLQAQACAGLYGGGAAIDDELSVSVGMNSMNKAPVALCS